jgi:dCTP deaminase
MTADRSLSTPASLCWVAPSRSLPFPMTSSLRSRARVWLGRIGLLIHATAGYVDPSWRGKLTLELSNAAKMPIALHAGMKIGQLSFMRMSTSVDRPYGSASLGSKYQGQMGPTPSRAHAEYDKDGE